jgi:hypothetical protein
MMQTVTLLFRARDNADLYRTHASGTAIPPVEDVPRMVQRTAMNLVREAIGSFRNLVCKSGLSNITRTRNAWQF